MSTSWRLSAVVAALACVGIPAVASAHGGNNDPNTVHACIGNVTKVVRIVGVGGSCVLSPGVLAETPAHWAIQGPQGAPGMNGAPGANGVNGTDGADGANGTNGIDGQDGQDGAPGATRPAPPCFDNFNRYVDCGNGTVTDTVTGLTWLKDAACLGSLPYAEANQAAATLADGQCGLADGSSAGDWRLPTKDEWNATIARGIALGCTHYPDPSGTPPSLTDDAGTVCMAAGSSSFIGVASASGFYWSSTAVVTGPFNAWVAGLEFGSIFNNGKYGPLRVWPVRGGPAQLLQFP